MTLRKATRFALKWKFVNICTIIELRGLKISKDEEELAMRFDFSWLPWPLVMGVLLWGCTPGAGSKIQPITQGGHVGGGSLANMSSGRDSLHGQNPSVSNITNNYYGLTKEELEAQLKERDKEIALLKRQALENRPTRFSATKLTTNQIADGKWFTTFDLVPNGTQGVPLLSVEAISGDSVNVLQVEMAPQGIGMIMGTSGRGKDGKSAFNVVQSIPPVPVAVKIVTDEKPGNLRINVDPWFEGPQ